MSTLRDDMQAHLGNDFTVERELDGGGMSRVFVARDRRLDRRVVVKLLRPDLAAGVSVERFRREIRTAASLQHALIVPVLDVGELHGLPYFLMPFIDGPSLRARMAGGPLTVVDTVRILRDVARALAVAHARRVVHRDIKPDNVLLSGDTAMVADFGVAKAFATARKDGDRPAPGAPITTIGVSLGTPAYMAPEQVAADPNAGSAMDIYAVGIMAYEMLTGAPPFTGRSPQAIMAAHITEEPPPLNMQRPGLPDALAALVHRCLAKDPARRPESAAALVEMLEDPTVLSGSFTPIPEHEAVAISGQQPAPSAPSRWAPSRWAPSRWAPSRWAPSRLPESVAAPDTSPGASRTPSPGNTSRSSRGMTGGLSWRTRRALAGGVLLTVFTGVLVMRTFMRMASSASASAAASGNVTSLVDSSPSVAVLPFVYLGADSSEAFLAQAVADAITDGLARVSGLRVASRSRAASLQGRLVAGDTVGFPVRTVVEGVVEQEGTVVRLTVRLVNTADGFTLFADRLEGQRSSLFALEDAVAAAMRERLSAYFELPDSTTTASGAR